MVDTSSSVEIGPDACAAAEMAATQKAPTVSLIIPAYNAQAVLPDCLAAVKQSTCEPLEVLLVNDGSTDETAQIAAGFGVRVLDSSHAQSGPAAARNVAAAVAQADVLMFVDADVVIQPDTIHRVRQHFVEDPTLGAVFGSYDQNPADPGFLSQYKNLQHHFVHHASNPDAETFWAGCGAVRRTCFEAVAGFDSDRFAVPSIEDIDLGYRLRSRGYRIRLDPDIQVCHLKKWTFWPLLKTEVFHRAIPWSSLLLGRQTIEADLNLGISDRVSAVVVWLSLCLIPLCFWDARWLAGPILGLATLIYLNRAFYTFLLRIRGLGFLLKSIPMHALYFGYSSLAFAYAWLRYQLAGVPSPEKEAKP